MNIKSEIITWLIKISGVDKRDDLEIISLYYKEMISKSSLLSTPKILISHVISYSGWYYFLQRKFKEK